MFFLQRFVFVFVCVSWLSWFVATCLYMPYILFFSPFELRNSDDPDSRIPLDHYSSGKISAVVIVAGLMVDSLLLSGIYKSYKIGNDMFYPWMIFYPFLIAGLIAVSVIVVMDADEDHKYLAVLPAAGSLIFSVAYVQVVRLFIWGIKKDSVVMREMNKIALQPFKEAAIS